MITTEIKGGCNDDGSSAYPIAAFDKVAIEYGVNDLPKDLVGLKERPKTWQARHCIREFVRLGYGLRRITQSSLNSSGPRERYCV